MGDKRKAAEARERLLQFKRDSQGWRTPQTALVSEADFLWLSGEKKNALRLIEESLIETQESIDIGHVGSLTRWEALLWIHRGRASKATERIYERYRRLERLDAIDQAEVLCSLVLLESHGASVPKEVASKAHKVLSRLPPTCALQISQLGLGVPK